MDPQCLWAQAWLSAGAGGPPQGQRGATRERARAAADLRTVSVYTMADGCTAGTLDGLHVAPRGPWWGTRPPESMVALRKPSRQYKPRRKPPVPAHHSRPLGGHNMAPMSGLTHGALGPRYGGLRARASAGVASVGPPAVASQARGARHAGGSHCDGL